MITGYNEFFNAVAFETGEIGNFTKAAVSGYSYISMWNDSPGAAANVDVGGIDIAEFPAVANATRDAGRIVTYQVPSGSLVTLRSTTAAALTGSITYKDYQDSNTYDIIAEGETFSGIGDFTFFINGILNIPAGT